MPTLFLTVGLPGMGKTTEARRLETQHGALRLTKDEWVKALFGDDNPEAASDVIEGRLVDIALRALELGTDVVLDFGLWSRDERTCLRSAASSVGAKAVVLYCYVPAEEQRRRLAARLTQTPERTWPISDADLASYAALFDVPTAGEVDGTEAIDPAPDGFGDWEGWRRARWPAAVPRSTSR